MTDNEINAAVHETFAICGNQHSWTLQYHNKPTGIDRWSCMKCPAYVSVPHRTLPSQSKDIEVPDYVNDPRLWAPLLEELLKNGRYTHCLSWWKDGYVVATSGEGCVGAELGEDKEIGRAVCLAYLTLHKRKDSIREDAIQT